MPEDTKNTAGGDIDDVHASRIDPNDSRLKLNKPHGRSLKKGPVIGILAAVIGVILIAFAIALQPPKQRQIGQEEDNVEIAEQRLPDAIRRVPDTPVPITAQTPDDVPPLGRPLPGDIGAAMVNQNKQTAGQHYNYSQQKSPDEQAYEKALTAGLTFGTGLGGVVSSNTPPITSTTSMLDAYADRIVAANKNPFGAVDQNKQGSKNDFYNGAAGDHKEYVSGGVKPPLSPYEVKAGTIIPASLVTGLNSDLPGDVIAQVRENVYDTVSGKHLLIPQGSRLIGKYNSRVSYGQSRAQVVWTRLLRPDGSAIKLESMPGVDLAGYSGFADKVDNHYDRLIGGVLLSSVLSVGATASAGDYNSYEDRDMAQIFAGNAGDEIASAGNKITRKNLDIQPTIKIRPGFSVNVLVNKDMIIPPFKS